MDIEKILYGQISFVPAKSNHNHNKNSNTNHNHSSNSNSNGNSHSNAADNSLAKEFQAPKYQLCDPKSIELSWMQSDKVGGGLINVGNTCFLNSVLQCLAYCPPLYNFLIRFNGGHSQNCKINNFCMLCEMEKFLKRIRSSNGTAMKPISIVQRLKYINKSFQFGRQEDAHEFLRYLIDHMWKACLMNLDISTNKNSTNTQNSDNNHLPHHQNNSLTKLDPRIKETTYINHIFGGYHRSQVMCLSCNSRSNTFDFFMDFNLDIRNAKSLEEALKRFTQPETLQNENAYKCCKCRKKVAARKKFTIFKAPNVATFQLKRFDSDRIFGGKVNKFISYPEELDLRPYMSDPTKSPIKYQLSAVLVHIGHSSNSGHYFCFIKNSNNFWYRMDDSNVSMVTPNTVLQQQAYVLFYTRKSATDIKYPSNGVTSTNSNTEKQTSSLNKIAPKVVNKPATIPSTKMSNPKNYSFLTTWNGSKSRLDDEPTNESSDRDKFNEELDRGKTKKIKSYSRDDRFSYLSKSKPFLRFASNSRDM